MNARISFVSYVFIIVVTQSSVAAEPVQLAERAPWWSLQPVQSPSTPQVRDTNSSRHAIDAFVLSKLEAAGLPAPASASIRTLARRLSLVLTGLPLPRREVDEFLANHSSNPHAAYAELVDRLLESPHFGERWARHWMDIVRFTETHGNEWNYEVHHAWRYRDYLIRALNADVPYDQLVREHIAGDLLPSARWNPEARLNESVIGTAFYRFGEVNHDDCISLREIGFDILDNQLDTLTKAFQGLTVACARCHDHKFDPISTRDYYALLGILRSSRLVAHTIDEPSVNADALSRLAELKDAIRKELAANWLEQTKLLPKYLLAADAAHREQADAASLAGDLDPRRLDKWIAAFRVEKPELDHLLSPWLSVASSSNVAEAWQRERLNYDQERKRRSEYNQQNFVPFGDFSGQVTHWRADGQGLRVAGSPPGLPILASNEKSLKCILPAGC